MSFLLFYVGRVESIPLWPFGVSMGAMFGPGILDLRFLLWGAQLGRNHFFGEETLLTGLIKLV